MAFSKAGEATVNITEWFKSGPPPTGAVRAYVAIVMGFMSRGIVAASQEDDVIRSEVAGFPEDFTFEMKVLPGGPAMRLKKNAAGAFALWTGEAGRKPTLSIQFKHLRHAWNVLTFQEGTIEAFTNDRMVIDGDIAGAMRMVRVLNRFQALNLPAFVARRTLKRYPRLTTGEKSRQALRIQGRLLSNLLKENRSQ